MKTKIFYLVGILLVGGLQAKAEKAPSPRACKVLHTWLAGSAPSEICQKNGGAGCATAKNKGQALCLGLKGDSCAKVENTGQGICYSLKGSSCDSVSNLAQGICYGLDESMCSALENTDSSQWKAKLADACDAKPPAKKAKQN